MGNLNSHIDAHKYIHSYDKSLMKKLRMETHYRTQSKLFGFKNERGKHNSIKYVIDFWVYVQFWSLESIIIKDYNYQRALLI